MRLASRSQQSHNAKRSADYQSHNAKCTARDQGAAPGDEAARPHFGRPDESSSFVFALI